MGLVLRRAAVITGTSLMSARRVPHRTFRAWLVLHLGPPPQPPRRYFSKSLNQGGRYRQGHSPH